MSSIPFIESVLVEYAGPMGKFVLKKKVKEMELSLEAFPEDRLWELAQKVVPDAIFDPAIQQKVLKILKKGLIIPSL